MKKTLVLFLAILMVLSSFVACTPADDPDASSPESSSDGTPSQSLGESSASTPESEQPSETEEQLGNLPEDIDLKEKEIVIISRDDPWMEDEVSVDEENTGDPIDNAIYMRNLNVETWLNVKLDNYMVAGDDYCVVNQLKNTVGPDCPYHIAANSAYTSFENTAAGLFYNLYDVEHIDLDQKYWATKYNEEASIGKAQYFATGAISLSLRRFIFVTFFNKRLANVYGIEDLYQVVNDKRWTIDYQASIIANMFSEMDGVDGPSDGDAFGFLTNSQIFVDPYIASCDVKLLIKDNESNTYKFEPEAERLDTMMVAINNLYYGSDGAMAYVGQADYSDLNRILEKFSSGEATMITHRLIAVEDEKMRNMEDAYGIIPIPKLEESQEEYYSLAHDLFTVYGVVSSVNSIDLSNVGAVLEAMAIESYKVVTPAYYEVALKGKYSKDEESWAMLDMIVSNLKINGGLLYTIKLADITQKVRTAIKNKQTTSATSILNSLLMKQYEKLLNKMQNDILAIQ